VLAPARGTHPPQGKTLATTTSAHEGIVKSGKRKQAQAEKRKRKNARYAASASRNKQGRGVSRYASRHPFNTRPSGMYVERFF
jgi:hypothetical protein